ncbi:uncharacterized protein FOMMEDRAFT_16179 [Fomitiporia mediterranea MF3/22]|uniref:uncharacterized protein n=1 Tax=Fomitiporia mediterranea (strain MF3/22) TaxID=694068 RepID=UPI0004409BC4|nr:uncharacterized protein FOMMEDRAFT_16179 [Fomitiporia mediterranea MF3/22]EJD07529.1 hypothetical protein FOMMEDRAFT_16179 [Fomitiporia mediterranea MF3/22]
MHLPLRRRDTKRPGTPTTAPQAAPSIHEASGTSVKSAASTPGAQAQLYDFLAQAPSQQQKEQTPPHGLKGLGRRMTGSKPVRMLKSIASKTSLRGHGRHTSSVAGSIRSTRSVASQHEAVAEETANVNANGKTEEGVKGRTSGETDYGKDVTNAQAAGAEVKSAEVEQSSATPNENGSADVIVKHEAEARPEPNSAEEPATQSEEPKTRIDQNDTADMEQATPAVEAASESMVIVDVDDAKNVKDDSTASIDAREQTRRPEEEGIEAHAITADIPSRNAETISLSSSSTTVDPPVHHVGEDSAKLKQAKMEQDTEPLKTLELTEGNVQSEVAVTDVNPFLVDDPEDPLSEPEAETKSGADTPIAQSVVLSTQLESDDTKAQTVAPVVDEERAPSPEKTASSTAPESSPLSSSSSSEEEAPELHVPALAVTSLFLPVPQVRTFMLGIASLTWWLTSKAASYPLAYFPALSSSRLSPLSYLTRRTH